MGLQVDICVYGDRCLIIANIVRVVPGSERCSGYLVHILVLKPHR